MRIAYIANSVVPSRTANSINVMKMCGAMAGLGHDVTLYLPDRTPKEPAEDVFDFYGVNSVFRTTILPWRRVRGRSYLYTIAAVAAARRSRPRLGYTRLVPAGLAMTTSGMDVVLELHAPPEGIAHRLFSRMSMMKRLRRVVCISTVLAERIANDYPRVRERIIVAHDGADDPVIARSVALPSGTYRIEAGYAGHLYAGKGMEVISELASRCPWARFHVVGGMAADIQRWTSKLPGVDNVVFHGFVPHSKVAAYLRAMDVLLAPYQHRVNPFGGDADVGRWMSPLKLFEYMAVGRPIICSDLPTLREVLDDGDTALLCDPTSVECWADALRRLADDPAERARLATRARAKFERQYTWSARASRILDGLAS